MTCGAARNLRRVETLAGIEAPNVPGPVAAARLRDLGAHVTKIESPAGDMLAQSAPRWYAALHRGCTVEVLDAKSAAGRAALAERLDRADVLLTSSRLSALERAGHDLNYVAQLGLVSPPAMPRTLLADLAGAERAVTATLGLLLRREREGEAGRELVSLREAAVVFAQPLAHGLTKDSGVLGGAAAIYRLYAARTGWVAVGALEPHFAARLGELLGVQSSDAAALAEVFATRDATAWEAWGDECGPRPYASLVLLRARKGIKYHIRSRSHFVSFR